MTGLKQLPRDDVYQAWVQRDGRIEPSSLFDARRDGTASAAIPHQLDGADAVMVTREPRGGSKQPTSTPIVTVSAARLAGRSPSGSLRFADGDLLPAPRPRDRRLLLQLRAADLPRLHDPDPGRDALPRVRAARRPR